MLSRQSSKRFILPFNRWKEEWNPMSYFFREIILGRVVFVGEVKLKSQVFDRKDGDDNPRQCLLDKQVGGQQRPEKSSSWDEKLEVLKTPLLLMTWTSLHNLFLPVIFLLFMFHASLWPDPTDFFSHTVILFLGFECLVRFITDWSRDKSELVWNVFEWEILCCFISSFLPLTLIFDTELTQIIVSEGFLGILSLTVSLNFFYEPFYLFLNPSFIE